MAHHRLALFAPFALTAALGTAVACQVEHGGPAAPKPEDVSHDVELTVGDEEVEEVFVREDDRLVSPADERLS